MRPTRGADGGLTGLSCCAALCPHDMPAAAVAAVVTVVTVVTVEWKSRIISHLRKVPYSILSKALYVFRSLSIASIRQKQG